jgi:cytochrome c peroxidase
MKRSLKILVIILPFIVILSNLSFTTKEKTSPGENMKQYYLQGIAELKKSFSELQGKISVMNTDQKSIDNARSAFLKCRSDYKKIEFLVEYYNPNSAEQLNGPLILKVSEDDGMQNTIHPEGFQVLEDVLWSDDAASQKEFLNSEMNRYKGYLYRLQETTKIIGSQNFQIFEAMRFELIRIFTIGLTGFDSPAAINSADEAQEAFRSIKNGVSFFRNNAKGKQEKLIRKIEKQIDDADLFFAVQKDFDSFDRMKFIVDFVNPVYADLVKLEEILKTDKNPFPSAIYSNAQNIFNLKAWNPYFYSPDRRSTYNKTQADLGKMLFFDPLLSGNNERSCASCHNPKLAFTDGAQKSMAFDANSNVMRNAPTLINAAFQSNLFLDSRIKFFEFQIPEVNQNKMEMHGDFIENIGKLNQSSEYRLLFKQAFKGTVDTSISTTGIMSAIASYERTLIAMNSRFDQYMNGKRSALNSSEINGFNIFMGKAQCGTCHFAPLFNGTVPPYYEETEWENLGTAKTKENKELDADEGRYNVANMTIHKYFFKTPTVRNIELIAPYMHNGVYTTLEEVMDFYNKGGGVGHGYEVPNQTLPSEPLNLNEQEITDVIAFMKSLTDTAGLTSRPSRLPAFEKNEVFNARKIGGSY